MTRRLFDIFIGGPMGNPEDDGAGFNYSQHLGNLNAAVSRIAEKLNGEQNDLDFTVLNPATDAIESIIENIFSMIDRSSLGILDLSKRTPNVMYEIAFLHALGTPVIPVLLSRDGQIIGKEFYISEQYCAIVSNFSVDTLFDALMPKVRLFLQPEKMLAISSTNPITKFYGLPLVDLSATTGLATTYYVNFIRHVIRETGSIFQKVPELKKFIVLRPNSISEVAEMKATAQAALRRRGIDSYKVLNADGSVPADESQVRGEMLIFRAGNYLFDTPAPLNAQKQSPRHKKMAMLLMRGTDEHRRLYEKFERTMIDQFFNVVYHRAVEEMGMNPNYLGFMTIEEFCDAVATG